jgi:hypothetical protein
MSNPDFMDCIHRTCTLRPAHLDISHAKRDERFESNVGLLSEVASTKSLDEHMLFPTQVASTKSHVERMFVVCATRVASTKPA